MTAPSGMDAHANYHGAGYGGMFSPATYSGAGFPQSLASRQFVPNAGPPGIHRGRVYPTIRQDLETGPPGRPADIHEQYRRDMGSSSNPFSHQASALPTSTNAVAHYPRSNIDYASRRASEDQFNYNRPGTSDTARPDTAASAFSSYSTGSAADVSMPLKHPSVYTTVGQTEQDSEDSPAEIAASAGDHAQKYNFIPLPSQPKKRPRRRFEEIERLYDCNYPGCNKSYGTLNHLNAHASMQKHGPKRLPAGEPKLSQLADKTFT